MKTIIVAVIPGTLMNPHPTSPYTVGDLTKPEFLNLESFLSPPDNLEGYLEEIQNNIGEYDYLIIDAIPSLLKELEVNYLSYVLAIPKLEQKLKWVGSLYISQKDNPERNTLTDSMYENFEILLDKVEREHMNSGLNPAMISSLSDCFLSTDNFYIWSTTSGNRK